MIGGSDAERASPGTTAVRTSAPVHPKSCRRERNSKDICLNHFRKNHRNAAYLGPGPGPGPPGPQPPGRAPWCGPGSGWCGGGPGRRGGGGGGAAGRGGGGGGGAGVTITPVAFLVISDGEVTIKHITAFDNAAERVVNLVPEMFDKVTSVVNKAKKEKEKAASNDAAEYVSAVPAEDVPSENK